MFALDFLTCSLIRLVSSSSNVFDMSGSKGYSSSRRCTGGVYWALWSLPGALSDQPNNPSPATRRTSIIGCLRYNFCDDQHHFRHAILLPCLVDMPMMLCGPLASTMLSGNESGRTGLSTHSCSRAGFFTL